MTWDDMILFAVPAMLLWLLGTVAALRTKTTIAVVLMALGLVVFGAYIALMWVSLERPPLRTMGETRLWYSFFLPLAGLITYVRWRYKWILSFSTILATVFICINLLRPEIHNKTLMPALQSPWFAPHVIVYMFAYALLGAATLVAIYLLIVGARATVGAYPKGGRPQRCDCRGVPLWSPADRKRRKTPPMAYPLGGRPQRCDSASAIQTRLEIAERGQGRRSQGYAPTAGYAICDNLVYVGVAFMTVGMLFGALWAKEAWGHYWSWDPKETWAAITWFAYLMYIHARIGFPRRKRMALWVLIMAFIFLQMCWWGVNYLPAAQGSSVHTYTN